MTLFDMKLVMVANQDIRSRKTVLYSNLGLFSDSKFHENHFWSQNGHMAFLGVF